MYHFLDIFFLVLHTSVIIINIFGWIWKPTRKLNLVLLLATGSSWLFLGLLVGTPGYCPFTDWHFSVLEKLGETNLPSGYVEYLARRVTGLKIDGDLAGNLTLAFFLAALLMSVIFNVRDYRKGK